jgi:hypothetical protein
MYEIPLFRPTSGARAVEISKPIFRTRSPFSVYLHIFIRCNHKTYGHRQLKTRKLV